MFIWSIQHSSPLSFTACLSGPISGIQMFFCFFVFLQGWIPAFQNQSYTQVGLSACLSERHAPPPGHSHELNFQVVQHWLSNWPKWNAHWGKNLRPCSPGRALFVDPSFNTSSNSLQHSGCCSLVGHSQTKQGVHNLVMQTQCVMERFWSCDGKI